MATTTNDAVKSIGETFDQLKLENKIAFIPFVVAGDPNLDATEKALKILGATIIAFLRSFLVIVGGDDVSLFFRRRWMFLSFALCYVTSKIRPNEYKAVSFVRSKKRSTHMVMTQQNHATRFARYYDVIIYVFCRDTNINLLFTVLLNNRRGGRGRDRTRGSVLGPVSGRSGHSSRGDASVGKRRDVG